MGCVSAIQAADGREGLTPARPRPGVRNGRIKLLLGDEQPLVRRGLRALFENDPAFRVQGEAANGASLLELASTHRPDMVLMDADLPGPDLLDVVRRLVGDRLDGSTGVVLLASEGGLADGSVLGAARAGVRGFLFKRESSEIVSGVRDVAWGGAAMSPGIVGQVLKALRRTHRLDALRPSGELALLTPREMQIFQLVAQGLTNQQIADVLVLSEATVKSHFNRICRKLALRNRVDAVILAYEMGVAGAVSETSVAG
ncbi:DNA-binding response regulator [Streptomyces venezuelae]|uniref:DNA-binding response regulator n=1 Tax=Streptomyces venezuelae TaxID=54571 RepID=A0A5P2C9N5_STRVZ|nr:DNA-binding response regulator [Streptomyces venezuelae]